MPRVVTCPEEAEDCPLKANPHAKFCSKCGASASNVTTIEPLKCSSCDTELPEEARFCHNCGNKVIRPNAAKLIEEHEKPTSLPGGARARGLTPEEMARIQHGMTTLSGKDHLARTIQATEVSPDEQAAYRERSSLHVPGHHPSIPGEAGRVSPQAPEGKHVPGMRSASATLPSDYASHVRVIPYKFNTPARSRRQIVDGGRSGGGRAPEPVRGSMSAEDAAYYRNEPPPIRPPPAQIEDRAGGNRDPIASFAAELAKDMVGGRTKTASTRDQAPDDPDVLDAELEDDDTDEEEA